MTVTLPGDGEDSDALANIDSQTRGRSDSRDQGVTIPTCSLCHASSLYPSPWELFPGCIRALRQINSKLAQAVYLEAVTYSFEASLEQYFYIVHSLFLFDSDHAFPPWTDAYPLDGDLEEVFDKSDILLAVRRQVAEAPG